MGERDAARRYLEEALTHVTQESDPYREAVILVDLDGLEADAGRYDVAAGHLGRALTMFEDLGEGRGLADAHRELATLAMRRADLIHARRHLEAAMTIHTTMHDPHHRANVLRGSRPPGAGRR